MLIYYPSCTFRNALPETAKAVIDYLQQDMGIAGCCRAKGPELGENDTAVVICGSCKTTLENRTKVISLWEYLLSKDDFPLPNYGGLEVNIQDCWRNRDQPAIHNAVREILKRMNVTVIPVSQSETEADFCGTLHYDVKDEKLNRMVLKHWCMRGSFGWGGGPIGKMAKEV